MLTIQKNRRACDRCHSQKLSCKRETIDGPCMRCFRAKAFCSITPKPKRSRQWSISGSNTRTRKSQSQFTDLEVRGLHLGHDSACGDENLIYDDDVLCLHEDPHMAVPDFSNDIFGIGKESESMYNGSNGEENFADDVTRKTEPWGNQFFDNRPRLSGYQAHHMEPSDLLDPILFNPVETLGSLTNDVHSDGHTSPSLSPPLTPDDLDFEFLHGTSRSGATQFSHKAYARHGSPVTKLTPMHCPPGVILDDSMPHANSRGSNEWIEMVTQLNIRLYEHYSATEYPAKCIPGQLESRAPPSSSAYAPGSQLGSVDETFTLSQQLLDIYSQGVSSASIPARVSSLRLHGKMREEASYRQLGYSSAMLGNAVKGNQESQQAHDPASLLLLLSCRLRLLHIYQNLLRHLQDWLTEKPSSLQQNNTHVPTLSIGSFSLGSLPTLQVTVIIQLMEHFLSQLQQISKCVLPDRSSDVADITLGAIKKNEAEALQTLRRVKQMINMI